MTLDSKTFTAVANLIKLPKNTVEYFGAYGSKTDFFVGIKNQTNDYVCGCIIRVTQDMKIDSVHRITISQGRFTRNYPVRRIKIPLYVAGL